MAIYLCKISNLSRAKGSSSCATLSYITAQKVKEERINKTHNFGRNKERFDRVVHSSTLLPEGAPEEYKNPAVLFNSIENFEKAENARPAKKMVLALPRELDLETMVEVVENYIKKNITAKGYACTYAIHVDEKDNNPHVHILIANRQIGKDGSWQIKRKMEYALDENGDRIPRIDKETGLQARDSKNRKQWVRINAAVNPLDKKEMLLQLREGWSAECNKHLSEENQISHLSNEKQLEHLVRKEEQLLKQLGKVREEREERKKLRPAWFSPLSAEAMDHLQAWYWDYRDDALDNSAELKQAIEERQKALQHYRKLAIADNALLEREITDLAEEIEHYQIEIEDIEDEKKNLERDHKPELAKLQKLYDMKKANVERAKAFQKEVDGYAAERKKNEGSFFGRIKNSMFDVKTTPEQAKKDVETAEKELKKAGDAVGLCRNEHVRRISALDRQKAHIYDSRKDWIATMKEERINEVFPEIVPLRQAVNQLQNNLQIALQREEKERKWKAEQARIRLRESAEKIRQSIGVRVLSENEEKTLEKAIEAKLTPALTFEERQDIGKAKFAAEFAEEMEIMRRLHKENHDVTTDEFRRLSEVNKEHMKRGLGTLFTGSDVFNKNVRAMITKVSIEDARNRASEPTQDHGRGGRW